MFVARILVVTAVGGVVAAGAPAAGAAPARKAPRLQAFSSCPALVGYARRNAARFDGGTGVAATAVGPQPQVLATRGPQQDTATAGGPQPATAQAGRESAAPEFSGTNVQEVGVDEPDVVKTDGKRLVAITDATLRVLDVTGAAPALRGVLALDGTGHQLLVRGDTALVMATPGGSFGPGPRPGGPQPASASFAPEAFPQQVLLTEVDLADPAKPTVRRTLVLDGRLVDARQTGGTARVVVTSPPKPLAEEDVETANVRTWVPKTVLRSKVSGKTFTRGVVACDDVRRPPVFSGLDLLSVLTIDLDRGLYSVDRDAILAGAQSVYASTGSLYVASTGFGATRTQIHRYDAAKPDRTSYRATGEIPGFVLNQYGFSEHEGALRVATTTEPAFGPDDGSARASESQVTVLKENAGRLLPVGRVGGLGRGERIFAVRFVGDRGYVVTFRRVDPLYVLDLADPTTPRVRGELKIAGYSAYLHPVGADRLLGIGQDATAEGRTTGAQASLFDVSDPARPRRLAQAGFGADASSTAEFDPHAFLFWEATNLAVLPVERFGQREGDKGFVGVVGLRVGSTTLAEVGRVTHPDRDGFAPLIGRTLVVGGRVLTLSAAGLGTSALSDLTPLGFTAFGAG